MIWWEKDEIQKTYTVTKEENELLKKNLTLNQEKEKEVEEGDIYTDLENNIENAKNQINQVKNNKYNEAQEQEQEDQDVYMNENEKENMFEEQNNNEDDEDDNINDKLLIVKINGNSKVFNVLNVKKNLDSLNLMLKNK